MDLQPDTTLFRSPCQAVGVLIKITGVIVDMLVKIDRETYRKHMVFENGKKAIYVVLLREILWNACSSTIIL